VSPTSPITTAAAELSPSGQPWSATITRVAPAASRGHAIATGSPPSCTTKVGASVAASALAARSEACSITVAPVRGAKRSWLPVSARIG
jgi:hypothetical protein